LIDILHKANFRKSPDFALNFGLKINLAFAKFTDIKDIAFLIFEGFVAIDPL
jgi:hypothetical protein